MKNNKIILLVMVFVLALVSWIGFTFYKAYQPKAIVLQGEIDAQSYNISSKVAGRISKVFVKKGVEVKSGDAIFSISSPEIEAKVKQAKAAKDVAIAKKTEANNGARKQEIHAAYDQYKKAKAAKKLMKKTYDRIEKLYKQGVVSLQKRDEVYAKYKASVYTAKAAHQMAKMAKEGARVEVKSAADAQEKIYAGKLEEVNAYLKEINQYSSHKGEVSQILIHEGELSPVGFPVVSIIDMEDAWARVNVREDYLKYFQKGDILELQIPALGDKLYKFKVTYVAVQGDYATWKATESGKGFDMKSFEVELRPLKEIKNLRVGMSVLFYLD
jgi:HlyD family secretion protein